MTISIIRKSDIVAAVPARWQSAYKRYSAGYGPSRKDDITAALLALPPDFTAEQVNQIIGNDSWTENKCDECETDAPILVRIGDAPDYEARWLNLCPDCIGKLNFALLAALSPPQGDHP